MPAIARSLPCGNQAARPEGSLRTCGAYGIAVTVRRLLAHVAHAAGDPLGMLRTNLSRAERAATSPASFLGPSGHNSITWMR